MHHRFMQLQHNPDMYDALLSGLSYMLVVDIKLHLFRKLINNSPLLEDLTQEMVNQLVMSFEESVFSPADIIIREGDVGQEMFFIIKGFCEVLTDTFEIICTRKPGDYFGEIALLSQPHLTYATSETFSELYELRHADVSFRAFLFHLDKV